MNLLACFFFLSFSFKEIFSFFSFLHSPILIKPMGYLVSGILVLTGK